MRSQAPANRAASVRQRLLNIAKERGEDFNFEAAGIMATFDGGNSWMTIPGSDTVGAITAFAFDEVQAQVYISSYGRGLWRMGWCGPPLPQHHSSRSFHPISRRTTAARSTSGRREPWTCVVPTR